MRSYDDYPETLRDTDQILVNACRCIDCGDTLVSKSRHDFVRCSCGKVFTDGGREYIRRGCDGVAPLDLTVTEKDAEYLAVFRAAGLANALRTMARLLRQGTEKDLRNGPREFLLRDDEVRDHLEAHLEHVAFDLRKIDDDSGEPEAAHLAVRAMQILRRAIA